MKNKVDRENRYFELNKNKNNDFDLEPIEIDHTLLGNRIKAYIEFILPKFMIKWFHNHDCGCDKRQEWLNEKHLQYRDAKIKKAQTNYLIAKAKMNNLLKKWG